MARKFDVRIMKLKKWYVPKSVELSEVRDNAVVLGYFDELEIQPMEGDEELERRHPFAAGLYEYLLEVAGKALESYGAGNKASQMKQIRKTVKTMLHSESAIEIYNCVERALDEYKREVVLQKGAKG